MIRELKLFWQRTHMIIVLTMLIVILFILSLWTKGHLYSSVYLQNSLHSLLKLSYAMVSGSIIGYERSHKNRPAGLRTHSLVCIGAAIVMIVPIELRAIDPTIQIDVTRLGAQVISGIGFLGAGTIIRNGYNVKGLTTAATLWVVAIIGLAIGGGLYTVATASTIFVLMTLKLSNSNDGGSDE